MARKPRIKVAGHAALYHVVNRVNHKRHKLDTFMKQYFLTLLKKLKQLYFVKYAGFTILNNHYHLLLNFTDPEDVDIAEAMKRWNEYHARTPFTRNASLKSDREHVIRELTDVSSFMKRFNAHLTQNYNWKKGTVGTLWERRFRSSIMERGHAAVMCGAYIELNAFRASLVSKPEEYKFSSLYQIRKGNPEGLISTDLLKEGLFEESVDITAFYKSYLSYIYTAGADPNAEKSSNLTLTNPMKRLLKKSSITIEKGYLAKRLPELTEGKGIGSERIIAFIYDTFINPGFSGKAKDGHRSRWITPLESRTHLLTVCFGLMRGSP